MKSNKLYNKTKTMITDNTSCCDRCGRPIGIKEFTLMNGWTICGVCEWEESMKKNSRYENLLTEGDWWELIKQDNDS